MTWFGLVSPLSSESKNAYTTRTLNAIEPRTKERFAVRELCDGLKEREHGYVQNERHPDGFCAFRFDDLQHPSNGFGTDPCFYPSDDPRDVIGDDRISIVFCTLDASSQHRNLTRVSFVDPAHLGDETLRIESPRECDFEQSSGAIGQPFIPMQRTDGKDGVDDARIEGVKSDRRRSSERLKVRDTSDNAIGIDAIDDAPSVQFETVEREQEDQEFGEIGKDLQSARLDLTLTVEQDDVHRLS